MGLGGLALWETGVQQDRMEPVMEPEFVELNLGNFSCAVTGMPSNPPLHPVRTTHYRRLFPMKIAAGILAAIAKLLSGASVRWYQCQPDTCQRVYFANHTSHLDVVILWASLPTHVRDLTRPVAALDYWSAGIIRRYISSQFNAILIDRKEVKVHASPVDLMIREIGDTYSLIVFPEGSRSQDAEMQEFKSGLYHLSKKRPDLELVPVYIENSHRILPRGEVVPIPLLSRLTFGPPIFLEHGESKVDFLKRAREAVRQLRDV